jgi:gamma-glutamylputrescine oxidase
MNLLYANDRAGEYPPSYYAATATALPPFAPLNGAHKADVCIVGAGYTGLSAALHLAERGYSVIVLEAHRVGFGASGRNGGQVGPGQRIEQDEIERMVGRDDARKLWQIGLDARDLVQTLMARHGMDCGWKPGVLHAEWQARNLPHARAYAEKLARDYDYPHLEPLGRAALQEIVRAPVYQGGVLDHGAGHLHPLRYVLGLARAAAKAGAQICENSLVTEIRPGARAQVHTATGHVEAAHVLIAANGYLGGLVPQVAAKVMPINNFIIATEPLPQGTVLARDVAVADSKFVINYFRLSEDGRLLFGGAKAMATAFPISCARCANRCCKSFRNCARRRSPMPGGAHWPLRARACPAFCGWGQIFCRPLAIRGMGWRLPALPGRSWPKLWRGRRNDLI